MSNDTKKTSERLANVLNLVKTGTLNKPLVFTPEPYGEALMKLHREKQFRENVLPKIGSDAEKQIADDLFHQAMDDIDNEKDEAKKIAKFLRQADRYLEERIQRMSEHKEKLEEMRRMKLAASRQLSRAENKKFDDDLAAIKLVSEKYEREIKAFTKQLNEFNRRIDAGEKFDTVVDALNVQVEVGGGQIEVVVGYMTYAARTKGHIPIYPVIECWFDGENEMLQYLDTHYPRQLLLSTDNFVYKVFEPEHKDRPIVERNDPIAPHVHESFQRLRSLWGYWFLRVHSPTRHWDFQICGDDGNVYKLNHPIESTLSVIAALPEATVESVANQLQRGDENHVRSMLGKLEKLVGKLPVESVGHYMENVPEGKVFAWVHENERSMRWMTLDENNLLEQATRIVGAPQLQTTLWEDTRPGVSFMMIDGRNGQGSATVWLRAVKGAPSGKRGPSVEIVPGFSKHTEIIEGLGPDRVRSLYEDDVPIIEEKYYKRRTGSVREEVTTDETLETALANMDHVTIVTRDMHEGIIANFMSISSTLQANVRVGTPTPFVWPALRDAIIFELPPIAYLTLYNEFFRYIAHVAKLDPKLPFDKQTKKRQERTRGIISAAADAPFPEKMPFPACFFAYGGGVPDPAMRESFETLGREVGNLHGHLVTADGLVASFRHTRALNQSAIQTTIDRDPGKTSKWNLPHMLTPWIINSLVEYVNEHKVLIQQGKNGLAQQMLVKKTAKTLNIKAPIPPAFYVVEMKDELIRQQAATRASAIKRHIDWQHRWMVRGHDCIKFERGPLPISEEHEQELVERGYKVFTVTQPDAPLFTALAKRGVPPKGTNEWIAVLSYWRESFTKGPEDKPLIESTRRSTKQWNHFVDWSVLNVTSTDEDKPA
jgi:hypothetical protein